jgi:ribosomal protein S17E
MANTNNKKTMKKKLISAIAMLTVSAVTLSTATYAWFTMNKEVTLTGMTVKTHVGSNLLIQKGALTDTTTLSEGGFVTDEIQQVSAVLEPVSTVDGKVFYYTLDANGSGAKLHTPVGSDTTGNAPISYKAYASGTAAASDASYGNKFSEDYEINKATVANLLSGTTGTVSTEYAVGYVDYVFQLKATNTDAEAKDIKLTGLDLTYKGTEGSGAEGNKAFRAAIFVSGAVNEGGDFTNWTDSKDLPTANSIYKDSTTNNFTADQAVNSVSTLGSVTYTSSATPIATVAANSVSYYKVVVRLWIEGEDTTCTNNNFKPLTSNWELDLKMELDQGTAVTELNIK